NCQTGKHWSHHFSAVESRYYSVSGFPPFGNFPNQSNRAGGLAQSTYSFRNGAVTGGYQYEVENVAAVHAHRNNQGGFLDARWSPVSRLTLSAGGRAEANASFGTRVVPRAGAVLALRYSKGFLGGTRLRAAYGQGIEETTARLTRWLSLNGSYSHDDTRVLQTSNTFGFPGSGDHLLRRPVDSGNVWLNASYRRFNFNVNAYITGARADSDFDSVFSNGQCVIGSGPCLTHNAGYARFDLATNYNFPRGFSFYGRVTNLLDKQYQETIGFPALVRDYRLGLNYRFSCRN